MPLNSLLASLNVPVVPISVNLKAQRLIGAASGFLQTYIFHWDPPSLPKISCSDPQLHGFLFRQVLMKDSLTEFLRIRSPPARLPESPRQSVSNGKKALTSQETYYSWRAHGSSPVLARSKLAAESTMSFAEETGRPRGLCRQDLEEDAQIFPRPGLSSKADQLVGTSTRPTQILKTSKAGPGWCPAY